MQLVLCWSFLVVSLALLVTCDQAADERPTTLDDSQLDELWILYKQRYNKRYDNIDIDHKRRTIWKRNAAIVYLHNLRKEFGNENYSIGLNELADLFPSEYRQRLGLRRSPPLSKLPKPTVELGSTADVSNLPTTVNWTAAGWVTSVKNQLQCGDCWAFSACGALEGQMYNKTRNLVSLSEQNLLDCSAFTGNMGCNGGNQQNSFQYIRETGGLDTYASYPYVGVQTPCKYNPANSAATVSSFTTLPFGDEAALQQAVALVGPISVSIDASAAKFQLYQSGVYSNPRCSPYALDHAVLAVGYGIYDNNGVQTPYWLIKNSWGTDWGMQGYMMIARNDHNMCGIASDASYPIV